jgi:chromosome partitioning protein
MINRNSHATPLTIRELAAITGETEGEVASTLMPEEIIHLTSATRGVTPEGVRRRLKGRGVSFRSRIIAHITMRGGIGKTTATISAAVRAAQYGFRVCVLDLDPQGSSTLALNVAPEEGDPIFYDIWQNPQAFIPDVLKQVRDNLSLLPSSLENALLDASLMNPGSQKKAVKGVCDSLAAAGYETIIIDCPPSLGIAVISAICAADTVVIPVGSDAFSLKGLEITLGEIASIRDTFGLGIPQKRILFTRYDRREKVSQDAIQLIRQRHSGLPLNVIGTSSEFSKALAAGETVFSSYRKSLAKDDYDRYLRELLEITASIQKKGDEHEQR